MIEFKSFGAFSRHLVRLAAVEHEVTEHIVSRSAEHIRDDAKSRIGTYQDGTGPFVAWAPLAESTIADRIAQGFTPNEPLLRTGDLRDSIKVSAEGDKAIVGSVGDIAMYQELGTSKMPPRPFLGPAAYDSKHEIGEKTAKTMAAWVAGLGWKRPQIKFP